MADMFPEFTDINFDDWGTEEVPEQQAKEISETDFIDTLETPKKSMTIFFLIDTSGSMSGERIGTVNGTMEELLPELIGIGGVDTTISIAAMRYDDNATWITADGPVQVEYYQTWPRQSVGCLTAMGAAFKELNKKLSRSAFMNRPSLSYAPVFFLMSDGAPNDDWKPALQELKKNKWFQYGMKIAIGIGNSPNMAVLQEFTGDPELAIQVRSAQKLSEMIKFLTITSSQIGSRSMTLTDSGEELTAADVTDTKKELLKDAVKDIMSESSDPADIFYEEGW